MGYEIGKGWPHYKNIIEGYSGEKPVTVNVNAELECDICIQDMFEASPFPLSLKEGSNYQQEYAGGTEPVIKDMLDEIKCGGEDKKPGSEKLQLDAIIDEILKDAARYFSKKEAHGVSVDEDYANNREILRKIVEAIVLYELKNKAMPSF